MSDITKHTVQLQSITEQSQDNWKITVRPYSTRFHRVKPEYKFAIEFLSLFVKKMFKALVLFLSKGARKKSNEYLHRETQLAVIWCTIYIYNIYSLGSE